MTPANSFLRPRLKSLTYKGVCSMPGCDRMWESKSPNTRYCDSITCSAEDARKEKEKRMKQEPERTYPNWDMGMANKYLFIALRRTAR